MGKNKYLLISPDFPPPLVGGGVVWIYNLVQNCPDDFDVLTTARPKGLSEPAGIKPRLIRSRWIANSNNPPRLRLALSYLYMIGWLGIHSLRRRYQGVVVNMCVFGNSLFILLGKLLGLKIIGVVFAEEITTSLYGATFKDRIHRFLMKGVYRGGDGFFSVCHFSKNLLVSFGVPPDRIDVIPPCIDPTRIVDPDKKKRGGHRILSVGRLIERKGFHDLIGAVHRLLPEFEGLQLTLVGDGPMRSSLEAKVRDLGLEKRVTLAGQVTDDRLAAFYRESDLFVLAHRMLPNGDTEGAPTVFCEASGAGLPVVGGKGGGADTVIEEGRTGFIVDADRIEEIVDRIRKILIEPDLARRMGQAGREKVKREHLPEAVGQLLSRTLRHLLDERLETGRRFFPSRVA